MTKAIPHHRPTDMQRRYVEVMTANGFKRPQICEVIGISEPVLKKYYKEELRRGFTKIYAKISTGLAKRAIEGDRSAQIFWLKARAQWAEVNKSEISGVGGGPIDLREVSTKDLIKAVALAEGATGAAVHEGGTESEDGED